MVNANPAKRRRHRGAGPPWRDPFAFYNYYYCGRPAAGNIRTVQYSLVPPAPAVGERDLSSQPDGWRGP